MGYEDLKVQELRKAARHFFPETREAGSVAHVGNKEELIDFLRGKGVMECEVREFCEGNTGVEAPKDIPVIPVIKATLDIIMFLIYKFEAIPKHAVPLSCKTAIWGQIYANNPIRSEISR